MTFSSTSAFSLVLLSLTAPSYPSYPFEFLFSVFYNYASLPVLFVMIKYGPRLEFVTKFAGSWETEFLGDRV